MGIRGAPNTAFANVHGKFGQKKFNFHGLGAAVETDEAGAFSFTSFHLNYAYHMRLGKKYMLSSGLGIGFFQFRMDYGKMSLEDQISEPMLTSSVSNFVFPNFNFGLWLYKADRYYGFSIRQLTSPKIKGLPGTQIRRHITLSAGRAIRMSKELYFKPAVLLNYVGKSKPSLEAQALMAYKEMFAVGIGARTGNGLCVLMKLDAIRYVSIAYAYDLTASKMRNGGASSHEITIGLRACAAQDKYHEPCAAYQ